MCFAANEDLAYRCRRHSNEPEVGTVRRGKRKNTLRRKKRCSPDTYSFFSKARRRRAALFLPLILHREASDAEARDLTASAREMISRRTLSSVFPSPRGKGRALDGARAGATKRGAETWRIPAFAECRRRASGKVENGKKKGKRLVNVNIVLKVCFGVGKIGVEKTVCFLCTMHRE